jgi:hypothetical protein
MMENRRDHARDDVNAEVLGRFAAANMAYPESAARQMGDMVAETLRRDDAYRSILGGAQPIASKAGQVAEQLHAESFNLEAMLQDKTARALTDRDPAWSQTPYSVNDPVADIAIVDNGEVVHNSQVKYYKDPQATANAMREVRPDGSQHYHDADSFVGPSDQVHPTDGSPGIKDELRKTRLKNEQTRPAVATAAKNVEERVSDRLEHDGARSRPLSREEARRAASDGPEGTKLRRDIEDTYLDRSTLQQMRNAAVGAAAISAVMAGTVGTIQYLKLVKEGKITPEEAILGILKGTAMASADSALKAAAAAGTVSVVTRLTAGALATQSVGGLLARGGIAGAAVCAVDLVQCMVMVAAGRMSPQELETRFGKNILQTSGGVAGSTIGVSVAAALGATVGLAPVLAGIAGGLIVGLAVTIAVENGIEKPYREVMNNTASLAAAGAAMQQCSEAMAMGQRAFCGFLVMDRNVDEMTSRQITRIDQAGENMLKAIRKL